MTRKAPDDLEIKANPQATDERLRLQEQLTNQFGAEKKLKDKSSGRSSKAKFTHFPDRNKHALDHRPKRQPAAVVSYTDSEEFGDDFVYVCQKPGCTRFMVPWQLEQYTYAEQNRWFITKDKDDTLYVRCPQHIDEWLFQYTTGNLKKFREWAKKVKQLDKETNDNWSPLTPYPLDPKLLFHEDGTSRIRKWKTGQKLTWSDEGRWS